jgi:hypothetical protein
MRTYRILARGVTGAVLTACFGVAGCIFHFEDDCDAAANCSPGTSGSSSSTGTAGGTPEGCDPSKTSKPVAESCGVFVSPSGSDGNAGTKGKPLKTITAALAKGATIYACAAATPFEEAVDIGKAATLYGALDCASWVYDASQKTQLTAKADAVPLTITGASGDVEVNDFAIAAVDATADGGSSIAVLVAQATVGLTRCDLTAGNGKAGLAGAPYSGAAQAGVVGNAGKNACLASSILGGDAVFSMCGTPDSISGGGGNGGLAAGGAGSPGLPASASNGGAGEGAMACTAGNSGDPGGAGNPGPGAAGLGALSASGYTGGGGGDGVAGAPGQGGGGGGGAKGELSPAVCSAGMGGGASGGSGGSGGCGGKGGKGGGAGGASIALVSVGATLSFAGVTVKAGHGGDGGDGGAGQDGGAAGMGAAGGSGMGTLKPGCKGGDGGKGGVGGKGGGGTGGHAIGIAYAGKAPPKSGVTFTKGTPGGGGKGDNTGGNVGDGSIGAAADVQAFP